MKTKYSYIFLLFLSASCLDKTDPVESVANLRALSGYEQELSEASQKFSFDLFHQVQKAGDANQFFSPYSIQLAMAMAMNGNEGEVLNEYLSALRFDGMDVEDANKAAKELTEFLLKVDPKVEMTIANSIWYDERYQVKIPFRQKMEHFYQAEIAGLNFLNPQSVNIINNWINNRTGGLIKDMLDGIAPDDVMLLVNAIYYKGDWRYQFDKSLTKKEPFHLESGQSVMIDMMSTGKASTIKFRGTTNASYIEIPYSTGQYSMGIILPHENKMEEAEKEFTFENLKEWRASARESNAIIKMPKFKMNYKLETLIENFKDLDLITPFTDDIRNFRLLFESAGKLFISSIAHEAVLDVDEKGTEAAAATVVTVTTLSTISTPQTLLLQLDRPFIFFIQEKHSGAIIFMGKLSDPR